MGDRNETGPGFDLHRAPVSRRKFLSASSAVVGSALLYACGGTSSSGGGGASKKQLSGPAAQDILVWNTQAEATNINPIGPNNFPAVRRVQVWTSNGLLRHTNNRGVYAPDLATKIPTPSANGLKYDFALRQDVKWSDGTPFTADDVIATINAVLDPKYASAWSANLVNVGSIEKVDQYTVRVHNKRADRFWQNPFASIPMVKASEVNDQNLLANKPTGTGPFKVVQKVAGDKIVFAPNAHYFKTGLPRVKGLQYPVVPVAATIQVNLANGLAALSSDVPYSAVKAVEQRGVKVTVDTKSPTRQYMYFNTGKRPDTLGDVNFRQALAYAIDRQQVLDVVYAGLGTVAQTEYTPNTDFYDASIKRYGPRPDVAKAKALLAQAKKKPTKPLQLVVQNTPDYTDAATILQANWKAIGVPTVVEQKDIADWSATFSSGDFDLIMVNDFLGTGPAWTPQYIFGVYRSGASLNFVPGTHDPQLDSWIDTGIKSQDDATAQAAWTKIQQWLLDNAYSLCTCHPAYVEANGVPLANYTVSALGNVPLSVEDASIVRS
jgi:peptide/nickel transport system substrate-binding protein